MAFKIDQIYPMVNEIASQSLGEKAIAVVDTTTLIALGNSVLSSSDNIEGFTNTLVQRIGKTIVSFREYRNQLAPLVVSDFQWGAIVQKIKVAMPEATDDATYDIVDGESVDMYKVKKPKVKQKLFVKETPYSFYVTIQYKQLEAAFLSEAAMGSFISAIYGELRNKMELTLENLGHTAMNAFMASLTGARVINLVTNYNAITGLAITSDTAMFDEKFMRYAIGQMNLYSKKMRNLSTLYNEEGYERHTPADRMYYCMLDDFVTQAETVVQYAAFNADYVKNKSNMSVSYWQDPLSPMDIDVKIGGDEEKEVKLNNIVCFIFDRDALGTFRREEATLTTPINARARYFNTFWHEKQLWFNDLSENGIVFTLN